MAQRLLLIALLCSCGHSPPLANDRSENVSAIPSSSAPVEDQGSLEHGSRDAKTPADVARIAFDALVSSDYRVFEGVLPTKAEAIAFHESRMAAIDAEEAAERRHAIDESGGLDAVYSRMMNASSERFAATVQATAAIDWSSAEFLGLADERSQFIVEYGYEAGDVYFLVGTADGVHEFFLHEIIRMPRGWITTRAVRYAGTR